MPHSESRRFGRGFLRCAVLGLACAFLAGCAASLARNAVPAGLADQVKVAGVPNVRQWGDAPLGDSDIQQMTRLRLAQIKKNRPQLLRAQKRTVDLLAISGGGADGAFGAGILNGWSARGDRPQFELVAGVSTGALSAPFAFLGPRYDRQLKEIYTEYSTNDLIQKQVLAGLLGGSSVTNTKPLERLIARYMDREVIAAIAREYKKGRRLLVGTTNLDSERPVVWDMGAIAARGTAKSRALFRRVLLASAALPGLFPPVFIKVESDGKYFEEMHVDGGTTDNAFLLPVNFDLSRHVRRRDRKQSFRIFIIANAKLTPDREIVQANTFAIAGRSIATLIKQQLHGDLLKIYLRAQRNGIGFRLASIPPRFKEKSQEAFDKAYMRKLYDVGFAMGRSGQHWAKRPPEL